MRRNVQIAIVFLSTLTLTHATWGAEPCQCPPATPKALMDQATYVFNADIWDVEFDRVTQKKRITLDVNDTFKGKPETRIELADNEEGSACAIDFHEGESYLVYAHWRWGAMLTSRCWGTKVLKEAGRDVNALGASSSIKGKYYDKLRVFCMGRRDTPCCLNSLKVMREGGYLPQPEQGCPDETIPDRLRCDGSFVWCLPTLEPHRHNQ